MDAIGFWNAGTLSGLVSVGALIVSLLSVWMKKTRYDDEQFTKEFQKRFLPERAKILDEARKMNRSTENQIADLRESLAFLGKEVAEMRGEMRGELKSLARSIESIQDALNRKAL